MINKNINRLNNITIFNKVMPSTLIIFILISTWNSIINFYSGVTEGGYKIYDINVIPDKVYTAKLDLATHAVIEVLIQVIIFLGGLQLFTYINSKKLSIINTLIEQVINNQLNFEELIQLRLYLAQDPSIFEEQLKLVNARLELRLQLT